jgi:hypothetical protein
MKINYVIDEDGSHKFSIPQCGITAYGVTKEIAYNYLQDVITQHICELHQALKIDLDKIILSKVILGLNNLILFNNDEIKIVEQWLKTHRRDKK